MLNLRDVRHTLAPVNDLSVWEYRYGYAAAAEWISRWIPSRFLVWCVLRRISGRGDTVFSQILSTDRHHHEVTIRRP